MPRNNAGRSKPKGRDSKKSALTLTIAGAALLLLVAIASLFLANQKPKEAVSAASQAGNQAPLSRWDQMVQVVTKQVRYFKGSPDAPITLLEFSDFQ